MLASAPAESIWSRRIQRVLIALVVLQVARAASDALGAPASELGPDGAWYLRMAREVLAEGWLWPRAFSDGFMHALWPMTISAIWTLSGESLLAVRLFNLAAFLLLLLFSYALARRVLGPGWAWLAVLLVARHEIFYWIKFPQYEVLLATLFTGALGCWLASQADERPRPAFLAGALLGFAAAIQLRLLPLLVLLPLLGLRRRYALVAVTSLAVLLPFAARNWKVHGHFTPAPASAGFNLLVGNNPAATGAFSHLPKELVLVEDPDPYLRDREYARRAFEWMAANPGKLVARKLHNLWNLEKPLDCLLLVLSLAGLALAWRDGHRLQVAVTLGCLLYLTALHAVFFGEPRFRFWLLPALHVFAAHALLKPFR